MGKKRNMPVSGTPRGVKTEIKDEIGKNNLKYFIIKCVCIFFIFFKNYFVKKVTVKFSELAIVWKVPCANLCITATKHPPMRTMKKVARNRKKCESNERKASLFFVFFNNSLLFRAAVTKAKQTTIYNQNRKIRRRRQIPLLPAAHHTYVMKLFDRSVDLAQFREDTPLYPICRAWMANQPRNPNLVPKWVPLSFFLFFPLILINYQMNWKNWQSS